MYWHARVKVTVPHRPVPRTKTFMRSAGSPRDWSGQRRYRVVAIGLDTLPGPRTCGRFDALCDVFEDLCACSPPHHSLALEPRRRPNWVHLRLLRTFDKRRRTRRWCFTCRDDGDDCGDRHAGYARPGFQARAISSRAVGGRRWCATETSAKAWRVPTPKRKPGNEPAAFA